MILQANDGKIVEMDVVDGKFVIAIDPNDNGVALVKIEVSLLEVPSELMAVFTKKPA